MHPYLVFGGFVFESYTVVTNVGTVVGMILAFLLLEHECREEKYWWKPLPVLLLLMLIGDPFAKWLKGLFGGTNGEATHYLGRVLLAEILYPLFLIRTWKNRKTLPQSFNAGAVYLITQHFFNRIACWMNGCCGGKVIGASGKTIPTQLIEAACMLLIGIFLIYHIRKKKNFFYPACMGYALVIFCSEWFIDQPELGRMLGLTSIQAAAVLMVLWAAGSMKKRVSA